ncbi:anti-repressor SinI family protein [Robertmurraya andreesenii]|uniref:Sin domain-containing protein n=1 Tax=Anoxybacillus andreesenii TaxID=1325932 RepID=A0ABT9V6Z9_9BACL|nr:anti-repressor SinI family protein [Robertmurraya andreesenii]MDQ0156702.1 hypothetical protein [Robertmurraya andreesenii]
MENIVNILESAEIIPNFEIDPEWMKLILEAKRMGLTKEEIRYFLLGQ